MKVQAQTYELELENHRDMHDCMIMTTSIAALKPENKLKASRAGWTTTFVIAKRARSEQAAFEGTVTEAEEQNKMHEAEE